MTSTTHKTTSSSRRFGWVLALALLGASAVAGGGCNRAHLTSYYGQSYAAWFGAQYVHTPTATSEPARRALSSLDAQEAAAVSKNYRKTVGGQELAPGQGQMVMIAPPHGGGEGYTPPPSVPAGQ
jgi:hypothetical protein